MLVAVEGIDGAGKNTQVQRVCQYATAAGYRVSTLSFPRYSNTVFSSAIAAYLNSAYGRLDEVSPYLASLLYAGDRFESLSTIRRLLGKSDLLICDRYVPSNLVYQAAKLAAPQRADFLQWIKRIEYEVFALPQPDVVIYLDITISRSTELVGRKQARCYTAQRADLHESNPSYLQTCRRLYLEFASSRQAEPWEVIPVVDKTGQLRQVDAISRDIWKVVESHLLRDADRAESQAHRRRTMQPST